MLFSVATALNQKDHVDMEMRISMLIQTPVSSMYPLLFMESLWDTMCFRCGAKTMMPFYIATALNQKITCTYDEMWKSVLIQILMNSA